MGVAAAVCVLDYAAAVIQLLCWLHRRLHCWPRCLRLSPRQPPDAPAVCSWPVVATCPPRLPFTHHAPLPSPLLRSHAGQQPAGGLAGHGGGPCILLPGGERCSSSHVASGGDLVCHRRSPACRWPDLPFSVMPPCCAFLFSHRPPSVSGPPCCHWCPTSQDVYPRMTGRRPLKTPAIIRALFPAENIQAPRVAPMAAAAAPLGGGAAAGAAAAGGGFGGGAAAEGPAPAAAAAADGGGDGHHHAE